MRRKTAAPGRSSALVPVGDPSAVEVVRRDFDADPIALEDPNPEPAHLAGDRGEDRVAVLELHAEITVAQNLDDGTFEL